MVVVWGTLGGSLLHAGNVIFWLLGSVLPSLPTNRIDLNTRRPPLKNLHKDQRSGLRSLHSGSPKIVSDPSPPLVSTISSSSSRCLGTFLYLRAKLDEEPSTPREVVSVEGRILPFSRQTCLSSHRNYDMKQVGRSFGFPPPSTK